MTSPDQTIKTISLSFLPDPAVIPTVPGNHQTYVRLSGGANPYMGRVEVFHSGYWGSICDDDWTGINAGVICGMLGYSR